MNFNINSIFPAILRGLKELELNPLTLAFSGANKSLEKDFIDFYFKEKLLQIRAAIIIGAALYALFGVLDAFLLDDLKYTFWFIRFGIVIPLSAISFALTYSRFFKTLNQYIIMSTNLIGGIGIIAMVVVAGPPVSYSYYAGLILVFIYVYTFSGLRFIWAVGTSWCIVLVYEVSAVLFKDIPVAVMISNNFFFVASIILAMFAAYFIEYSLRRDFYIANLLEIEKEKVNHTKKHLERLVKERTIQLSEANEELSEELIKKRKLLSEQEKLQEQLVQSQKMEAVGHLAGGIAHDFNNLLSPLVGYAEMLGDVLPPDHPFQANADAMLHAALRARDLIQQILTFSRKSESEIKPIKLQPIVKEAIKLLSSSIPKTIDINQSIDYTCGSVNADLTKFHQIIMNLATNAYHAMEETGGKFTITLNEVYIEKGNAEYTDLLPGTYARLTVADNGIGMGKDVIKKVFDPYFTTKEPEKGTGLGMSVVHGIVKEFGGDIRIYSEPRKGTDIHVYLPIVESKAENRVEVKGPILGGTERILLVDDEKAVASIEQQMLERLGYDVTTRIGSIEALEEFKGNPDKFNLVVTDLTMPKMTGIQLAEEIKNIKGDIPIIICTGFSNQLTYEKCCELGIQGYILKPVVMRDFAETIRKVLDRFGES